MIVADANLIFSSIVVSELTPAAQRLRAVESVWYAPRLWRYEILNIFATLIKLDRITPEQANRCFRNALEVMASHERDPDPQLVLDLVKRYHLTAYDAQYLALADELKCLLYTQDKEVLSARPDRAKQFYVKG